MRPALRLPHRLLLTLASAGLLAALSACTSAPKEEPAAGPTARESAVLEEVREAERLRLARAAEREAAAPSRPAADKPKKPRDFEAEVETKTRKVFTSELELTIAEKKAEANLADKRAALSAAERKVEAATAELERYQGTESKMLDAKARLRNDRNAFRLEELEQELAQMESEYGKYQQDSPARMTGDIVIGRTLKQIEFAKRELQLAIADRKQLTEHTIPRKLASLEGDAQKAGDALAQATAAFERAAFENKLSVTKARNSVLEEQAALAKLEAERDEAESKAAKDAAGADA